MFNKIREIAQMTKNEELTELIRLIKFKSKLTQSEIAAQIGVSKQYLSDTINGRYPFNNELKQRLHEHFTYLSDNKATDNAEQQPVQSPDRFNGVAPSNFHEITYFPNVDGSMGGVQFMDNSAETREVIVIPGYSDCKLAINAYGDSMHPLIKSGQIVLMAEWQESFIDWGKIYLVVTKSGYRAIKRLFPGSDGEHITCKSENETSHPPFEVERADILKIFIVKGWICRDVI